MHVFCMHMYVLRLWPCKIQCHVISLYIGSTRSPICQHEWLSHGGHPAHHGRPEQTGRLTATGNSTGEYTFYFMKNQEHIFNYLNYTVSVHIIKCY